MSHELQVGLGFALLAGVLWGIGPLLLKRGLKGSNVSAATLIEQAVSVMTLTTVAGFGGEIRPGDVSGKAFWSFVLAGVIGASFGKIFYYTGIDKVGAAKATSIKNSSPILTTILAMVLLGESVTPAIAGGVLLIVLGIFALTEVQDAGDKRPGRFSYFFYPFMAAVCFGINPIFKKSGIDAATELPTFAALITQIAGLVGMLTAGRLLKIKPKREKVSLASLSFFVAAGIVEAIGGLSTYYALSYAPAVLVSPAWRISPLVTFALARFTLHGIEVVTVKDGLAAALIVGGVFFLTLN